MSKITKETNHKFYIGDLVYILHDYSIVPCIVIGVECSPSYKPNLDVINIIEKTSITYKLIKVRKTIGKNQKPVFEVTASEYDRYICHNSKVYGNVDDLLSDLEKTIEKF